MINEPDFWCDFDLNPVSMTAEEHIKMALKTPLNYSDGQQFPEPWKIPSTFIGKTFQGWRVQSVEIFKFGHRYTARSADGKSTVKWQDF